MPPERVPVRLSWTVENLGLQPDSRVLEIGGGRGVAAALVCARLTTGHYVGLDRSPVAVEAAAARNAEHVARGTARFQHGALEDVEPAGLGEFDAVFAVNVNLFWTRPARVELDLVRALLSERGRLWLTYESPASTGSDRLRDLLAEHLAAAGWTHRVAASDAPGARLLGLDCRPEASSALPGPVSHR